MNEWKPTPPPSGDATMRYGRLLEAFTEYGRVTALLRSVVSRLVPARLPASGRDREPRGTDGSCANPTGKEDRPNG